MRWFLLGCALALTTVACTRGSADGETIAPEIIVEAEPTSDTFDASDPEQLSGVSTNPSNIKAGDCFNEYVY